MKYEFITIGGTTRDISFFTDQGVRIHNSRDVRRQHMLGFENGAKIKVDKFFYSYGGGAANAAVNFTNLGFKTACLATTGRNGNGHLIIANLKAHGVDTKFVKISEGEESGSSFILISPDGERIIFAQRGSNTKLTITEKHLAAIKQAKNIYIASLAGDWKNNLRKIFSVVGKNGPQVFWNPGMTQFASGVEVLSPFLKKVKVLAANKDEAIELVLSSNKNRNLKKEWLNKTDNLIKILKSFGPEIVVITLGGEGVMAYDGKKIYRHAVLKEKKRVDTTGVGDIFNSSFAAGLELYKGNIDRALNLGLRNTAAKIGHLGAQNGLLKFKR